MDEKLKAIVARMIEAGESDANIQGVIDAYKKKSQNNVVTTTTVSPSKPEAVSTTSDTEPQEVVQPSGGLDTDDNEIQEDFESSEDWVQDPMTDAWSQKNKVVVEKKVEPKKKKFSTYLQNKTNLKLSEDDENILKGDVEFNNYPGKEDNRYYTRNGEWFKQSSDGDGSYNKVVNDGSINALNNYFLKGNVKEANLILQKEATIVNNISGGKIYTGLPGKENNEYKTNNGIWYRRTPGSKGFKKVIGEGATKYLDEYFLSTEELKVQEKEHDINESLNTKSKREEEVLEQRKEFLKGIDKDLMSLPEELVAPAINQKFGKWGIHAEPTRIGDALRVTSKYDKDGMLIDLSYFDSTNEQSAFNLSNYIWNNKVGEGTDDLDALKNKLLSRTSDVDAKYYKEFNDILNSKINDIFTEKNLAKDKVDNYEKIISENKGLYGDKDKYKAKIKSFEKIMKDGVELTEDQYAEYEKNIALYNKNYLTKEEREGYKAAISEYNKL